MAFDSTRLATQMKIKGSLPEGRFEDQELLDFAYDSLLSELVPIIVLARENYYVDYADFSVTAGRAACPIPTRALNGIVREVKLIKSSGEVIDLERINIEEIRTTSPGEPCKFYVSGNDVVLYPTPATTTSDTIRIFYWIRPSRIVPGSDCARVTAIDPITRTINVTIPSGWSTSNTFDLVKGRAHFDILGKDLTASSVAGGTITFDTDLPTSLGVGDYVSLAEETCFPMLPAEGHTALVQSAVTSALESMGDPAAANSAAKTQSLIASFRAVLSVRVEGEPKALGKSLL